MVITATAEVSRTIEFDENDLSLIYELLKVQRPQFVESIQGNEEDQPMIEQLDGIIKGLGSTLGLS